MLSASEGSEGVVEQLIDAPFQSGISNKKNSARVARYYRSAYLQNEDGKGKGDLDVGSPDIAEMPVDQRLLSRSLEFDNDNDNSEVDESISLKKKELKDTQGHQQSSIHPESGGGAGTYSLPANYEYPQLVKSLKDVYKEMFITTGLYVLNIVSAVGIVVINKFIYNHFKFPHGLVLTFYHFVLTSIGLQILAAMKVFTIKPVNLIKILPLSISFCSYVVLTNLSLQYNSGTFYQILVAPTIAILQFLFFGIKTELSLLPPMVIMMIGVAIATATELKLSILGLSIAFSGILMTAIYQILVGTKQKQLGLSAIQLLYYQAPLSSVILAGVIPFVVDLGKVINFEYSRALIVSIVSSAFCAFILNLSMYLVLGRSSALTYNIIGLSKLFLVLSLNFWFFERTLIPNFANLFGVFMAIFGVCSFSYVKFKLMIQENVKIFNKNNL